MSLTQVFSTDDHNTPQEVSGPQVVQRHVQVQRGQDFITYEYY